MTDLSRRAFLAGAGHLSVLALVSLSAGCATTGGGGNQGQSNAVDSVNWAWAADNEATRATHGSRIVQATADQAYRAAIAAMERLGLDVDEAASKLPSLTARRFFQQGGWSATPTIQAAEGPRLLQLLGKKAKKAMLAPADEMLTGKAMVSSAGKGVVRIAVDFSSVTTGACPAKRICFAEVAPAALRSVYFEYWTGFGEELIKILAEDAQAQAEARGRRTAPRKVAPRAIPKRKAKPPSNWKLPPSGWKPPPTG
jgi:hypothetical protein